MNLMLYLAVVLIWGTTWIAIFLQQQAADTPVLVGILALPVRLVDHAGASPAVETSAYAGCA